MSKNPPLHHKNCLQRVANGTRAHEAGVSKLRAPALQVYLLFRNIFSRLRRTVPASNWRPKLGQSWLISGAPDSSSVVLSCCKLSRQRHRVRVPSYPPFMTRRLSWPHNRAALGLEFNLQLVFGATIMAKIEQFGLTAAAAFIYAACVGKTRISSALIS